MEIHGVIKPRKGSSKTMSYGSVATAPCVTPLGAARVTMFVKSRDCYDIESVFAVMHLSPAEARDLAAKISKYADEAEMAAAKDPAR